MMQLPGRERKIERRRYGRDGIYEMR